ncbi:MAG: efflux RND transporter permease subunit, partial [Syntrophales bacterium]|nr:efflux RND transporter permease subunit [Syntrophales bacterium]
LWEILGVEYLYSIVKPGFNLTIVRFYVGEDMEDSLIKLYNKLMSNYDRIPPGVSQPLVKAKAIDDVPILTLTLWSESPHVSGYELRRIALELCTEIKKDRDVAEFTVIGGQRRQVRVVLDPASLKAHGASPFQIMDALAKSNVLLPSGSYPSGNREILVDTGGFLHSIDEVGEVVIAVQNGSPVHLRDVAELRDGPEEPGSYVFMGLGPSAGRKGIAANRPGQKEAVTIAIAKKKGANASVVAGGALAKVDALRGSLIPTNVNLTVTRNYGETAKEKSDELLQHMLIATVSVIVLIALALGFREAVVVAVAVPVTLALTLLINYLYGYTLNRVTLFALIFSIGILVDDAIVVVENIHRHFKRHGAGVDQAVRAVDEVGNPTILATWTVVAALLPMAFVSGLMGPYMRPIPVGASAAMLFSLLIAFIVSPWLGYKVLGGSRPRAHGNPEKDLSSLYEKVIGPLLDSAIKRRLAVAGVGGLLLLAVALVPLKLVAVKMLPFDNKSEMQVIIDMPEGSALEETAALGREMGDYLKQVPEVTDYQLYVGTAAPFNFNGLVRHYFLRAGANVADIQVNLAAKAERRDQSHDIAKRIRPDLREIGDRYGARIKVAEIPPGPPVLSTLVAEIYGPDTQRQIAIAKQVRDIFEKTPGVVDVDWYVEADQRKLTLEANRAKTAESGVSTEVLSQSMRIALSGAAAGLVHIEKEREPVEIFLRMPLEDRADPSTLRSLHVPARTGNLVPLAELVTVRDGLGEKTIYHKNLKSVTYVIGDVAGAEESPVYAILKMKEAVRKISLPEGYELRQFDAVQPWLEETYSMKWDGEWHITIEVFRDLGVAFAAVLVIIYILVVAWFRNFITPIVIMVPIPLTLVGILPGHWAFGAFFTATSMIGFIALSGIVVRNSILLVDFAEQEWRGGKDLRHALLAAGAVRLRPIVLTAAAVVVGSFVMIFDPIFQGLAIAMMFGAVASTGLTLVVIPLLYYESCSERIPRSKPPGKRADERPDLLPGDRSSPD